MISGNQGLRLLLCASASAAALASANQARAQDVDAVVVTGQRLAQQQAITAKRETFNISDGISSDDIGKLPDHNTAAALRRIPGMSVQEDQGEPRFPILRGLSSTYNRTTIDGAIVGSVDQGGRVVPLDIVPSAMAGRIEVIKAVTPEMDANAVGGIINVMTRSAFDGPSRFFSGTLAAAHYEQSGEQRGSKLPIRANFAAGHRFGPEQQFGVIVAASYHRRDSDIPQVEIASPSFREYTAAGAETTLGSPTGNQIPVPIQRRLFYYNNIRERLGGNLKFEWRPTDDLSLTTSAYYTRMEDDEERIESRYEQFGPVRSQTATTGTFATARNVLGLGRFQINRSIWGANADFKWTGERAVLDGKLIYSGAELDNPESTEDFRTPDARGAEFGFTYDTSGFYPRFTAINPTALELGTNYNFANRNELLRSSQESVYEARANLAFPDLPVADGLEVKGGGVYRTTERKFDQNSTTFTPQTGLVYTLANAGQAGPEPLIAGIYRFGPRISSQGALDFFAANQARFNAAANNITADFNVQEDVLALYGQLTQKIDAVTVVAGVRYEKTDVDALSIRTVGTVNTPVSRSGGYDSWMPGVQFRWDVTDKLLVRGAYTQTIGRPNFSDITAREAINVATTIPTLSRGNPDLKPRESRGFDLSVEYYIPDGVVAVGVFTKDIKNEIFSLASTERLDLGLGRGVETVNVTQAQNARTAKIQGIEANFQQTFSFLPAPLDGLGINANVTLLDTRFTIVTPTGSRDLGFPFQPGATANATLFYQQGPFEGRVSWNYISKFLETIAAAAPATDQFWRYRHQVDAQVSYRVGAFTLFAEVENLTDAGRRELTGPNRRLLQEAAEYGRTFWAGVSVRL
jgi:TonB-dependent receptor